MISPSADFETLLERFRIETDSAIKFAYAWDAIHAVAEKDGAIAQLLNHAPLFWATNLDALQASTLLALGRIFDPNPNNHTITQLMSIAHKNLGIFSKTALAARKGINTTNVEEWQSKYLHNVYEPSKDDFRWLKDQVEVRRKIYETKYRPLRHEVYAHRAATTHAEVGNLFAKTNSEEIQQLVVFLGCLYEDLWQLYNNGRKPTLALVFSSADRILEKPSPDASKRNLQERLVHEIKDFLERHAKDV